MNDINRFIDAQQCFYDIAYNEIKSGKKRSHWMWFIFPQILGLGHSSMARYYAIKDLNEAALYINNPILRERLVNISSLLLELETSDPILVFGETDAMKLKSSMTLFELVDDKNIVFGAVLDKFYDGKRDTKTLEICGVNFNKVFWK